MAEGNGGARKGFSLADAQKLLENAERELDLAARAFHAAAERTEGAARGRMAQLSWRAAQMRRGERARWFSQAGQDRFVDEQIFAGKRGGVFLDIGAYDGWTGSNTLFFELFRGWRGVLVEPSPVHAEAARACRTSPVVEAAIGGEDGEAEFWHVTAGYTQMSGLAASYDPALKARVEADKRHEGETITVPTLTLTSLIERHCAGGIDFVSLDIEGGEAAALSGFDFSGHDIRAWSIENNGGGSEVAGIMARAGYRLAEHIGVDEIYVRD